MSYLEAAGRQAGRRAGAYLGENTLPRCALQGNEMRDFVLLGDVALVKALSVLECVGLGIGGWRVEDVVGVSLRSYVLMNGGCEGFVGTCVWDCVLVYAGLKTLLELV